MQEPTGTTGFQVYDTTLRDGAQQEGLNLSVQDKLAIAGHLDELGVGLHRGRLAGRDPEGHRVLRRRAATDLTLKQATLAAFGATRKAGTTAADDPQVRALLDAQTAVVTLVAKSDVRHVERRCGPPRTRTCAMITDTVGHLREQGRRVFLDAEHFFDGYRADPAYAARGGPHRGRGRRRGGRAVRHQRRDAARTRWPTSCTPSGRPPARPSASTATTTPAARSPTRWPRSTPGRRTFRARSTGTASAPATPT